MTTGVSCNFCLYCDILLSVCVFVFLMQSLIRKTTPNYNLYFSFGKYNSIYDPVFHDILKQKESSLVCDNSINIIIV